MSYQFDSTKQQGFFQDKDLGLQDKSFSLIVSGFSQTGADSGSLISIVDKNTSDRRILLLGNSSNNAMRIIISNLDVSTPDNQYPLGQWNICFLTYSHQTGDIKYGVSGSPKNTATVSPFSFDFNRWTIGYSGDSTPSAYYSGLIGGSAVFDRVLTDNEIDSILTGDNPKNFSPIIYTPLIDGLRDWEELIDNPQTTGTDQPILNANNPSFQPPTGYKEITIGSAAAGIGEWGYRDDPLDKYGTIDDDSFDQFGDRISGLYENQEDQPGNIPAFFLEVEPNGIAENQITSIDIGTTGQRLQVGIYGDNGGYGQITQGGKKINENTRFPTRK